VTAKNRDARADYSKPFPPTRSSVTIGDNANRRIEPHKAGGVMAVRGALDGASGEANGVNDLPLRRANQKNQILGLASSEQRS
jgi:hypothetical protein